MNSRLLIFTDLDATLLDHYTYSFEPARPLLERLRQHQIPVIPTTSKTSAELMPLRRQLGLESPFIVENGAALFIPTDSVPSDFEVTGVDLVRQDGFLVQQFVEPRRCWTELLAELPQSLQGQFTTFTQLGVAGVAELTGLDSESAALACQRQYGEPVYWMGDEAQKQKFIAEVAWKGGRALVGGRFIHVSGGCSKALAMNWLADCYRRGGENVITIAAGDSENDREMLEQADIAVVIPSPVHPTLELRRSAGTRVAQCPGPEGWATEIELVVASVLSDYDQILLTGE